jgi:uncharacterized protein YnzC (UPF0291/DUF896 family)
LQNADGKYHIVDEQFFFELKSAFYIEMAEQCFRENNLSLNLYYNLLQLQAGENVQYAAYAVIRCLNEIYKKQKEHTLGLAIDKESKFYTRDYNELLRMIDRLKLHEITSINLRLCNKYKPIMADHKDFFIEMNKAIQLNNSSQ